MGTFLTSFDMGVYGPSPQRYIEKTNMSGWQVDGRGRAGVDFGGLPVRGAGKGRNERFWQEWAVF
jgi:hypothetical protein